MQNTLVTGLATGVPSRPTPRGRKSEERFHRSRGRNDDTSFITRH